MKLEVSRTFLDRGNGLYDLLDDDGADLKQEKRTSASAYKSVRRKQKECRTFLKVGQVRHCVECTNYVHLFNFAGI